MSSLEDILKNPISWAIGVIASIAAVDPTLVFGFAQATWLNLGQLFSFVSIAGLTLPSYWPPSTTPEYVIIGIGVLFAAKIAHGIWKTYDREL